MTQPKPPHGHGMSSSQKLADRELARAGAFGAKN
jgi:hypothetical protein